MDSYIVRVYRRTSCNSGDEVAGLVEEVGSDQRRSFQSFSGLMSTIKQIVGGVRAGEPVVSSFRTNRKVAASKN